MFLQSVLLLFALGSIDASFYDTSDTCVPPRLLHGRVRMRQRSRLLRFTCMARYELVGDRYATCRNGQWDVPTPVCVRASCQVPQVQNGLSIISHGGAWVIFFCFPNHELVGSPVIYCDGYQWNATAPMCIDATAPAKLSCDFEDPDLCGWKQDTLHDFDWLRLHFKTPSSLLFTGPSYDHTLGKGKNGHYMYIESTGQVENDMARLVSPIYESSLTQDGCFSFSYHMYGKTCGGLKVYQKPENLTMKALTDMLEEEKQAYLLFEKWGNLGDIWFNAVSPLKSIPFDFQIIIEGIRGSSYASDIAIDDVAILQGEKCIQAAKSATTPSPPTTTVSYVSCANRCIDEYVFKRINDTNCGCSYACIVEENCCQDFFDVCIFTSDTTPVDNLTAKNANEDAPQTLKLVAVTTESTSTTTVSPTTTTSTTTPRRVVTTVRTKPTTLPRPTTSKATSTSTTTMKTTTTSTKRTPKPSTTIKPSTYKFINTYKETKTTTKLIPVTTTVLPSTPKLDSTKKLPAKVGYKKSQLYDRDSIIESIQKELNEQVSGGGRFDFANFTKKFIPRKLEVLPHAEEKSTCVEVILVILFLALFSVGVIAIHAGLRSSRVRIALARFRGNRSMDSEVRYLSTDVDDI